MQRFFNNRFGCEMVIINAGECFVTNEKVIIHTLLGPCVSIVLFDPVHWIAGMNHFIFSESLQPGDSDKMQCGKYGEWSTKLLISQMMEMGGLKRDFIAKVFGGANLLQSKRNTPQNRDPNNLAAQNYKFAFRFLKQEKIRVVSHVVGGNMGRKIYLFCEDGGVKIARIENLLTHQFEVQRGSTAGQAGEAPAPRTR